MNDSQYQKKDTRKTLDSSKADQHLQMKTLLLV
jgi:hypothetical protein